jgi:fucose permease
VPAFRLGCLVYLGFALPQSTLGLLWPSMRLEFHQPAAALGIVLAAGVSTSATVSAATGYLLSRAAPGTLAAAGTLASATALAAETLAPSLSAFTGGVVLFGAGFGAIDATLNAYATACFGARQINWMHASYGLGAILGPLLVTALLGGGLSWRWAYGLMAAGQACVGLVLVVTHRAWRALSPGRPARSRDSGTPVAAVLIALLFATVQTGIESGAGIWGYLFLAGGRGLTRQAAGVALSAYWAAMFAGRMVLGPVADRAGPVRVLGAAVTGVMLGAALMIPPGPAPVAVAGLVVLGLAAGPVFPLLALTTARQFGPAGAVRTVSLQVAASAVGGALLPAGIGIAISAAGAGVLAPSLLILGLVMYGTYWLLRRLPRR